MKKRSLVKVLAVLLALAMIFVFAGCGKKEDEQQPTTKGSVDVDIKDYVLKIGDVKVGYDVFNFYVNMQAKMFTDAYGADALAEEVDGMPVIELIKTNVLEALKSDNAVVAYLMKEGFVVDEKAVENTLFEFKRGMSADQYNQLIALGGSDEIFKDEVRRSMYVEEFLARLNAEAEKTDEFKRLVEEEIIDVKARHILVDTEEEAREIIKQLKEGEKTFSELAAEHSKDGANKEAGGDLGYFPRGVMVTEFENAAFNLEVGEVSEPVKTTFGYHVIMVEDKRTLAQKEAAGVPEDELRHDRAFLVQSIVVPLFRERVEKIFSDFDVDVDDQYVKDYTVPVAIPEEK